MLHGGQDIQRAVDSEGYIARINHKRNVFKTVQSGGAFYGKSSNKGFCTRAQFPQNISFRSGRRIRPDHLNVLSGNILEPVHNLKCLIKSHQRYRAGRETGGLYRVVNFFIEIRDVNDGNGYIFL